MAVAAAIGVGEEQEDVLSNRLANATNRLSGKRSLLRSSGMNNSVSQQPAAAQGLSEINRSIEKMTLQQQQPLNNGESSAGNKSGCKTARRDSDWTSVSTEDPGYGSMRSDQVNSSRRCSELSTASQVGYCLHNNSFLKNVIH